MKYRIISIGLYLLLLMSLSVFAINLGNDNSQKVNIVIGEPDDFVRVYLDGEFYNFNYDTVMASYPKGALPRDNKVHACIGIGGTSECDNGIKNNSFTINNLSSGPHTITLKLYNTIDGGPFYATRIMHGNNTAELYMARPGYCKTENRYSLGISCTENPNLGWQAGSVYTQEFQICVIGTEICDGIDNDCDGQIDEGVGDLYYRDADNDGYGNALVTTNACSKPSGYVVKKTDCDDSKRYINPGAIEVCDGIDNDCDRQIDEGLSDLYYLDNDGDGYGSGTAIQSCTPVHGRVTNNLDIDDNDENIFPGAKEICDGKDNDGDGSIDGEDPGAIGLDCVKGATGCTGQCTFISRKTATCDGTIPENSSLNNLNNSNKFTQNYSNSGWAPNSLSYRNSDEPAECAFKCNQGYFYDAQTNTCSEDLEQDTCNGTLPSNTTWNDFEQFGKYTYLSGSNPNYTIEYSLEEGNCKYKCSDGYYRSGSSCVPTTRTKQCTAGNLPANTEWTTSEGGTYLQEYNGSTWIPVKEFKFEKIPATCNYYCISNKRNCDANLVNGCEVDILNDKNNCGICGKICSGECISGICIGGENNQNDNNDPTIDLNIPLIDDEYLCENLTCNENEFCSSMTGVCACEIGYSDCDGIKSNGCETQGSCTQGQIGDRCYFDTDCEDNEMCSNGYCEELSCNQGYEIENNTCVCDGSICGENCYQEDGICCNGKWNKILNSCNIDISAEDNIVSDSGDFKALGLITSAKNSINDGEVLKGKVEAMLAVALVNQSVNYLGANLAVNDEDYEEAYNLLKSETSTNNNTSNESEMDVFQIVLIIIIILIIGRVLFYIYKNYINPSYDFE